MFIGFWDAPDDARLESNLTCCDIRNRQSKQATQCGPPSCSMPIAGAPKFHGLFDDLTHDT